MKIEYHISSVIYNKELKKLGYNFLQRFIWRKVSERCYGCMNVTGTDKVIYLNLKNIMRFPECKNPMSQLISTITHEHLHILLQQESNLTSHKWDKIADKLRSEGYLGG